MATNAAVTIFALLTLAAIASEKPKSDEPPPKSTVRVAGIVLKWIRGDKEANWRRIEPMIREAAAKGAKIVCTTECFLDGYAIADKTTPLEEYRSLGEPIPSGKYFQRLAGLAAELKIHLIAGMTEADGEARYNTAVLIGPDGSLIGKYRKQKLEHETVRNTPGNVSPVFETPHGRLGLVICADRRDPDLVRRICTQGADCLICPSGGMFGPKTNDPILQARSRENAVPIVFVHPAEFLVTGSDGTILQREFLGDKLLIEKEQQGRAEDMNKVFFFDLPLAKKSQNGLPLLFSDDFEKGADHWQPTDPKAWKIIETDRGKVYSQFQQSQYKPPHRSPLNISLLKDLSVMDLILEAKVQSTARDYGHRDMCLFFGYVSPNQFYYVHLGKKTDDHANQIFIVNGSPRKKISTKTTPGTNWDDGWHTVRIIRRVSDGKIEVYFDEMKTPAMEATDKTFTSGRVGIGSFDDIGNWDDVKLYGTKKPPSGPILKGRIVDENGKPMPGARVVLYSGLATRWKGQEATTDKNGDYRFDPSETGGMIRDQEKNRWDLFVGMQVYHETHASADGKSWWDVRVPGVDRHEEVKDFKMVPGGQLSGKIVHETTGKPLAGLDLRIMSPSQRNVTFLRYTTTDKEGRFSEKALFPGEYVIDINSSKHRYHVLGTAKVEAKKTTDVSFRSAVGSE